MQKQTLNTVSELIAVESIPKAKKGEKIGEFVQRAYPLFEQFISESSNPVINEVQSDSEDALKNAVSKLEARIQLVKQFCRVNDPFDIEPPKEATVQEILEHNGIEASAEKMQEVMGAEQFEEYVNHLKEPKKDGLTKTEIAQKREEHYAQYTPVFPSEKTYTHNGNEGTTRGFHWQSSIQDEYLKDHLAFLDAFDLNDSFPVIEETDEEE